MASSQACRPTAAEPIRSSSMAPSTADALTIAVFAPVGRDGSLTCTLLSGAGLQCRLYASLVELCADGLDSYGAIVLTEEALEHRDVEVLREALAAQPGWSDIAVLLFAGGELKRSPGFHYTTLSSLSNVTVVERPVHTAVFISLVQTAQRARARQYEMRDILVSLHAAREEAERASR